MKNSIFGKEDKTENSLSRVRKKRNKMFKYIKSKPKIVMGDTAYVRSQQVGDVGRKMRGPRSTWVSILSLEKNKIKNKRGNTITEI